MDFFAKTKFTKITRISAWLSVFAAVTALLVIFSWLFNALYLITITGDSTIIKLNAGLCFLALALSLLLVGNNKTKKTGIVLAVVVLLFNLLNLSQYVYLQCRN